MRRPVRTGGEPHKDFRKVYAAMALFILFFLLFLALASVFGLTADTRESTARQPANGDRGWRSRPC
jgi:hypothetical protein